MTSNLDIYRSAEQVLKKCGTRYCPEDYAIKKMNTLYNKGDFEGATIWARIRNAVRELVNHKPMGGIH